MIFIKLKNFKYNKFYRSTHEVVEVDGMLYALKASMISCVKHPILDIITPGCILRAMLFTLWAYERWALKQMAAWFQ